MKKARKLKKEPIFERQNLEADLKFKEETTQGFRLLPQWYRDIHRPKNGKPFMELICPHGIGHHKGVHGCDGCCSKAPKELWDKVTED